MNGETGLHMTVVQAGGYWRAQCECGWSSGAMPFPDPDAAYHAGTLHDAVAHPERIDWKAEAAKMRRSTGPEIAVGEGASDETDLQTVLPIIKGWEIVEQALTEMGVAGSHDPMFRSRAEQGAKAIVARLAHHDPPILLCFADEVKDSTVPAPDATVLLQRAYVTLQALKRGGCDWDLWHDAEAEQTVEELGEFLWPDGSEPVE